MTKPENLYLLVKILNSYLFFFQHQENTFVNAQDINDLLSFIKETVDEMEDQGPAAASLTFLENTKQAVRVKGGSDGTSNPKMAEIQIWADLLDFLRRQNFKNTATIDYINRQTLNLWAINRMRLYTSTHSWEETW